MKQRADAFRKQARIALFLTAAIVARVLIGIASYQRVTLTAQKKLTAPLILELMLFNLILQNCRDLKSSKTESTSTIAILHLMATAASSGSQFVTQQAMTITKNQWSTYASGADCGAIHKQPDRCSIGKVRRIQKERNEIVKREGEHHFEYILSQPG